MKADSKQMKTAEIPRANNLKKQYNDGFFTLPSVQTISDKYDINIGNSKEKKHADVEEAERVREALASALDKNAQLLTHNEMLSRQLEKRTREVEHLNIIIEATEPVPGINSEKFQKLLLNGDEGFDYRDSKIVSLAKKIRKLTVSGNKEKVSSDVREHEFGELKKKCDKLQAEIDSLNAAAAKAKPRGLFDDPMAVSAGGENALSSMADRAYQRELNAANKTIDELKRKLTQSADEMKTLTRALTREIGDGVTLEQAVDGGWRGRAQQIVMLKNKVKRLESALAADAGSDAAVGTGFVSASRGRNDVDAKAQEELTSMSNDRKVAVDVLTEERAKLLDQCQSLESKQKSLKARLNTVEADAARYKQQVQVLLGKTETDDQLIDALREEVSRLKSQLKESKAETTAAATRFESLRVKNPDGQVAVRVSKAGGGPDEAHIAALDAEVSRLKRICKQQASQINTQEEVIKQLRSDIKNRANANDIDAFNNS